MIEVEHLIRRYGDTLAVDDVGFTVGRGEVIGLLGHNGAGKSTVMKMVTGALEPTAGRIVVDGIDLADGDAARRTVQRRIGYLPENCPVWPDMTVVEFLEYQAALHGVPLARRASAVARAARRTALADKATAPIHTLSRGYRQRMGVAQAILHEPDIVILDEPTNGLDPTQILHMRELIRELARQATVIVSTHILQEVQAVCERVLVLRRGRLVVDTRLDALQRDARLRVGLDRDDDAAWRVLAAVPGVAAARRVDGEGGRAQYTLRLQAPVDDVAPAVAQAVIDAGWRLHLLQPERRDLEALFAEVNAADAAAPAASAHDEEMRHAA